MESLSSCVSFPYLGKLNTRPLTTGDVATMNPPVLVRATALIVFLPNLAFKTFLQAAGVALRLVNVLFVAFAQRETCAQVHV